MPQKLGGPFQSLLAEVGGRGDLVGGPEAPFEGREAEATEVSQFLGRQAGVEVGLALAGGLVELLAALLDLVGVLLVGTVLSRIWRLLGVI